MRFMVETLTNLKNNKVKNQTSQGGNESKERISRFVAGIDKKYHGKLKHALSVYIHP